ncbi:MAG: 6,7-dimethyl-8-ribityllumazine synthase [Rhodospirillaceae bacterium]|nr:6,7-dimethyl-8-ribityllumazine synthase [Rhodospirillaceae bacterium]|tara:strand:- start:170 stop:637 length:468 start_codon:yes stop_codon:yes gene_type:complete
MAEKIQPHIMIVEGRYYEKIQDHLLKGAVKMLEELGASHELYSVPGAFEIPAAIGFAAKTDGVSATGHQYDGFIALGCVIRGETSHYEHICNEVSRGLMDLSLRHSLAIGFGLLTCENREQALVRAAVNGGNKGGDAARTCIQMITHKRFFQMGS